MAGRGLARKPLVRFVGSRDASAQGEQERRTSPALGAAHSGLDDYYDCYCRFDAGRMLSITLKEARPRLILIVAVVATVFVVVATVVVVAPAVVDAITIHARPVNRPVIVAVIAVVVTVIAAITTVIAERNA